MHAVCGGSALGVQVNIAPLGAGVAARCPGQFTPATRLLQAQQAESQASDRVQIAERKVTASSRQGCGVLSRFVR